MRSPQIFFTACSFIALHFWTSVVNLETLTYLELRGSKNIRFCLLHTTYPGYICGGQVVQWSNCASVCFHVVYDGRILAFLRVIYIIIYMYVVAPLMIACLSDNSSTLYSNLNISLSTYKPRFFSIGLARTVFKLNGTGFK